MDEAIKLDAPEEPRGKFQTWKYAADVIKWLVSFLGVIVEHIKANPFPKRDAYQTV